MSEYNPFDDAFAVVGKVLTEPDDSDFDSEDLVPLLYAESKAEYRSLVMVLAAMVSGLADVVTDGNPQHFMEASALRPEWREQ